MEDIIEFINDLGINFWKLKILNFFFNKIKVVTDMERN